MVVLEAVRQEHTHMQILVLVGKGLLLKAILVVL
jgi:hypothetical protein